MSAAPATAVCFPARRGPGGDAFCRSLGTVNRERPGTAGSSLFAESPAFALVIQLGWAKLRFLLLGPYHLLPAALLLPPSPHPFGSWAVSGPGVLAAAGELVRDQMALIRWSSLEPSCLV